MFFFRHVCLKTQIFFLRPIIKRFVRVLFRGVSHADQYFDVQKHGGTHPVFDLEYAVKIPVKKREKQFDLTKSYHVTVYGQDDHGGGKSIQSITLELITDDTYPGDLTLDGKVT